MKRRNARENAVLLMFEYSFNINEVEEIVNAYIKSDEYKIDSFAQNLVNNYFEDPVKVDDLIIAQLKGWSISRLPRVNTAILRVAVSEMMYSEENVDSIVINEAVEITKKYGGDNDYQFVNGVLGSIAKELHPNAQISEQNGDN